MKKFLILLFLATSLTFAEYNVGDVCDNVTWTDSEGTATSIYEQTENGKAVMIFWGGYG